MLSAQSHETDAAKLGGVTFPIACDPKTQPAFNRGAARAAELSRDRTKAKTYYTKLIAIADRADGARPELRQARTYLAHARALFSKKEAI